jgi:hypothetical protein
MMRKITTYLIATLFLALPALAQVESAAYMTVRLDDVPATAQDAFLQLDVDTWVPLDRVSEDEFTGEFLLLSGLYDKIAQPDIRFLDLHGREFSVEEGVKVQISSSNHSLTNLQAILNDDVDVVVSGDVMKQTVVLEDTDGTLLYPRFEGSAFTLPAIGLGQIATVHAQRNNGSKVSYAFGRDVDIAELEDALDL